MVTSYTSSAAVLSYSYLLNPTGWATRSRILTTGPEKIQDTPVSNDLTLILDMQLAVDKLSNGGAEITLDCTVELAPNYWRAVAVFGHHQVCSFALAFMLHLASKPHIVELVHCREGCSWAWCRQRQRSC